MWNLQKTRPQWIMNLQGEAVEQGISQLFNPPLVHSLSISTCGNVFGCGAEDGKIRIFRVTGSKFEQEITFKGHLLGVSQIFFLPEMYCFITGGNDGKVLLWDVSSEIGKLKSPNKAVHKKKNAIKKANKMDPEYTNECLSISPKLTIEHGEKVNWVSYMSINGSKKILVADQSSDISVTENKLQTIKSQYIVLDSGIQKLSEKFDFWNMVLEQDEMWTSLLEDKFNSVEINLFYSYICETIQCLHYQVVESIPDLVRVLPTLSSVLRRKDKNKRIKSAWESALEILGLQEEDVKLFCTFFITYSQDANYFPDKLRQDYTQDIQSVVNKVVNNQVLHHSLLCAINVVENKKV